MNQLTVAMKIIGVSALCVGLLGGCATSMPPAPPPVNDGAVSWKMATDPAQDHYRLKADQTASRVQLLERVSPVYPASLLSLNLPVQEIPVKAIVDEDGKVTEVRATAPTPADDVHRDAFFHAVVDAVQQWRYTPLLITDGDGNKSGAATHAMPFSMDYVFRFEIKDGKPVVADGLR
jgi:hypothetical protein